MECERPHRRYASETTRPKEGVNTAILATLFVSFLIL